MTDIILRTMYRFRSRNGDSAAYYTYMLKMLLLKTLPASLRKLNSGIAKFWDYGIHNRCTKDLYRPSTEKHSLPGN